MTERPTSTLKKLFDKGGVVVAPGLLDGLSARLAKEAGFEAVYMGGNVTTASRLGKPDMGLLTVTEMADQAARLAEAAELPLVVDADNGHGGPLNTRRTVQLFERAGCAGLHIEDQALPKKCGHFAGRSLVSKDEMLGKLKAALDARTDPDLLIIARTDALELEGIDSAMERAAAYYECGADMLMFSPPCKLEHFEQIKSLGAPLLAIMDTSGRTYTGPAQDLATYGVRLGILPTATAFAIIKGVRALFKSVRENDGLHGSDALIAGFKDYHGLLDLEGAQDMAERYGG